MNPLRHPLSYLLAILFAASPVLAQDGAGPGAGPAPGGEATPAPGPSGPAETPPAPSGEPPSAPRDPSTTAPGLEGPVQPPTEGAPAEPLKPDAAAEEAPAASTRIPKGRGRIEGTVVDARNGEPVIEAQVRIVGTKRKALTDVEGHYSINLPPGVYDLRVFGEGLPAKRINKIEVVVGKSVKIDVTLGDDAKDQKITVQEVVVVAQPDKATEAVQLVRRQKAATVSDGISAEQIARTPDTSASEAVKRVVGATIQDGRYFVVRGLGGRYSLALLNGVILPSPDPDLPAVPLDLFPTSLLSNLNVAKTFTPDMPGAFAGGALLIETRDFPTQFTLRLRVAGSGDSQATFRDNPRYAGGRFDYVGFDDGTRALPDAIPRDRPATDSYYSDAELARLGATFSNKWSLYDRTAPPNLSLGATVGDTLGIKNQKLGYLASVSFSNRRSRQTGNIRRPGPFRPDGSREEDPTLRLRQETGFEVSQLGGLVNVGYQPSPLHRLALVSLYVHNTENAATEVTGLELNTNTVQRNRLVFRERQMTFTQLTGEDSFAGGKAIFAWQGNFAYTRQDEPDMRDLARILNPSTGVFLLGTGVGGARRTFSELGDYSGGAGADLTVPLPWLKLKVGGQGFYNTRTSRTRRFDYLAPDDLTALPNEQIFSRAIPFDEATNPDDAFDAKRGIYGGYAMADVVRLEPLRIIAGARYEISGLEVTTGKSLAVPESLYRTNRLTDRNILPSVNLVYALGPRTNLRGAYTWTLARPHMRELAPVAFFDYVRRRSVYGNAALEQTTIQNADLRWETFLEANEVLAVSGFYKHFDKPIERIIEISGDGTNVTFRNAPEAYLYGLELEARLTGRHISSATKNFFLGTNFSFVKSEVHIVNRDMLTGAIVSEQRRALQAQSPYVANAELGYRRGGTQVAVLYNVYGARIFEVGAGGEPDVYEQPIHRLDATLNQELAAGFQMKLSAYNLLDQRFVNRQAGIDILEYKLGVGFMAQLEWAFEKRKENAR